MTCGTLCLSYKRINLQPTTTQRHVNDEMVIISLLPPAASFVGHDVQRMGKIHPSIQQCQSPPIPTHQGALGHLLAPPRLSLPPKHPRAVSNTTTSGSDLLLG